MDSLMEALQSGAAFRDRRKRTPRNGKAPEKHSHYLPVDSFCYQLYNVSLLS